MSTLTPSTALTPSGLLTPEEAAVEIFPDAQAAAIAAVRAAVGAPVASRIPAQPSAGHVRVWRSGGSVRDVAHDVAVITYQAWHTDEAQASLRARRVQMALHDLTNHRTPFGYITFRDEIAAPTYLPDPDREGYIYQGSVATITRIITA